MSIITLVLIIIVALIVVSVIAFAIRIVPQSKAYVVERIGAYNRTCGVGLHILVPFLDRVANLLSQKITLQCKLILLFIIKLPIHVYSHMELIVQLTLLKT